MTPGPADIAAVRAEMRRTMRTWHAAQKAVQVKVWEADGYAQSIAYSIDKQQNPEG